MEQPKDIGFWSGAYATLNSGIRAAIWYSPSTDTLWTPVAKTKAREFYPVGPEEACYEQQLATNRQIHTKRKEEREREQREAAEFDAKVPAFRAELKALLLKYGATIEAGCGTEGGCGCGCGCGSLRDQEVCLVIGRHSATLTPYDSFTIDPAQL